MYSMVLLAALTTAVDMPDRGRRGGGCCGCYGGMGMGWGGGCYGGMGMGMGGGCYGGMGMGMGGGCYGGMGMGMGGGCYGGMGMGMGGGCYGGMGWGGGRGGYVMNGVSPMTRTYAYSPILTNYGTPIAGLNYGTPLAGWNGAITNPGVTQSFYANPALTNAANEATIVVHLPEGANLTIDGQPTQSRSATRIFNSPPLERGKTYTYTLRGEMNRDGNFVNAKKTIEVRAGERSEVTLNFDNANRGDNQTNQNVAPGDDSANQINPATPRRTPPAETAPGAPSSPTPPRDR